MSEFLIADDLSGALDAAAAFHHAGRRVVVVLSPANWPHAAPGEFVAFTTETRNAAPDDAAAAVALAIARGRAMGGRLVYKKIDSTLRGPVAAELAALTAALPGTRILFLPANPAAGRTVCDGVLRVHGVPVAQTEFGRDPVSPVRTSMIRELLGPAAAPQVRIADAESEGDLVAAVAAMDASGGDWVGVGSGALAKSIAARTAAVGAGKRHSAGDPSGTGPTLFVCGSAHARNREQASALAGARGVPRHELRLDSPARTIESAIADLRSNGGAMLMVEEKRHADATKVVRAVAGVAWEIMAATATRRVFITGGETAFALCGRLGITALDFAAEIEAGLSLSRGTERDQSFWFAIKPGGFGDGQTWVRAWDALQGRG